MKNKIELRDDYAIIYAREREQIIVDKDLAHDLASNYKWHINKKDGEPMTNIKVDGKTRRVKMKSLVKNSFQTKRKVYYKSENKLDNRRKNLTFCNNSIILYRDYAIIMPTSDTHSLKDYRVIIDLDDVEKVKRYSWTMKAHGYMFRQENRKTIYLHDYIADFDTSRKPEYVIDHIDRNPANNRKENLRVSSHVENQMNKAEKADPKKTSKYKGVSWDKDREIWRSRLYVKGKEISLGYFHSEVAAAQIYNNEAYKHFGNFAYLNEIPYISAEKIEDLRYKNIKDKHTKYAGVTYHKHAKKWISCFRVDGKYFHVGTFKSEREAAEAYNDFIIKNKINKGLNIL